MSEETLNDDKPFDMLEVIDRVTAQVEEDDSAEEDGKDVGPDASDEEGQGELTDEEADSSADDNDAEDDEIEDDQDQPEGDESEATDDQAAPEGESQEDEASDNDPEQDSKDVEIESLKKQLAEQNQLQTKLLDILEQQKAAFESSKAPPSREELDPEVIRMALYGDPDQDMDAFKALDPATIKKAEKFRSEWAERQARYAADPKLRYQEEIRDLVLQDVQALVSPFLETNAVQQAETVFREVAGDVTPDEKREIGKIYMTLPGADSPSIEENRKALEAAVKLFRANKEIASLRKVTKKSRAKVKQQRANQRAARKGSAPRSSPGTRSERPRWTPGVDLAEYAKQLEREGLV